MFLVPIINPFLLIKPAHTVHVDKIEFLEKRDPVAIRRCQIFDQISPPRTGVNYLV